MEALILKYIIKAEKLRQINTDASICAAVVYEEIVNDLNQLKKNK